MDHDDLVQEAVLATLDGTRAWEPAQVKCASHLYGCIKGIRHTHVKKAFNRMDFEREFERQRALGRVEERDASQIWDFVRARSRRDPIVLRMLDLLHEDKDFAEIKVALKLDEHVYNLARKRFARRLKRRHAGRKCLYCRHRKHRHGCGQRTASRPERDMRWLSLQRAGVEQLGPASQRVRGSRNTIRPARRWYILRSGKTTPATCTSLTAVTSIRQLAA